MQDTKPDGIQPLPPEDAPTVEIAPAARNDDTLMAALPEAEQEKTQVAIPTPYDDTTEALTPTVPIVVEPSNRVRSAWPPQTVQRRRRAGLPPVMMVLTILLIATLLGGGIGLAAYETTTQYQHTILNAATSATQSVRSLTGTAHAADQGTANALNTAQANIEGTATAQANTSDQATATVENVTATAAALSDLYTNSTNGVPVLDDPLSDDTGSGGWDQGSPSANTGCTFTDNVYHVSEAQQSYFQPCLARNTRFSSFAYQIHLTFVRGNQGQAGLLFRTDSSDKNYYFFRISTDGSYALDLYQNNTQKTLASGTSSTITTGLNESNQLTVVADSNTLSLFANGQYLAGVADSTLSVGKIGVGVIDRNTPVDVAFNDAQVWTLQSAGSPQPSPSATPDHYPYPDQTPTVSATRIPFPRLTPTPPNQ